MERTDVKGSFYNKQFTLLFITLLYIPLLQLLPFCKSIAIRRFFSIRLGLVSRLSPVTAMAGVLKTVISVRDLPGVECRIA